MGFKDAGRTLFVGVSLCLSLGFAFAQQASDSVDPEAQIGAVERDGGGPVTGKKWMISTANPHAGAELLRAGGNAIDAMVAVQTTLGLVEPQSSGLGGGGLLLYWDNAAKKLTTYDGRETAPLAIDPTLFLDDDGKPLQFFDAVVSGLSVGVPGMPKLLHEAHKKHGILPWGDLFDAPIRLAAEGFEISPRMAGLVDGRIESLSVFERTRLYFLDGEGRAKPAGTLLKNPDYAETVSLFRDEGADAFYAGRIGEKIVETVQGLEARPGTLSKTDLEVYRVKERPPVCTPYRGLDVCGMGPPTSGGIAVGQMLGILQNFDMATFDEKSIEGIQLIGDATRLAFADRARYVADKDFVPVPVKGLLKQDYLKRRAGLLKPGQRLQQAKPGVPTFDHALNYADDQSLELPSTTHFVIRDEAGNVVSMTSSIESAFGSNIMVGGFLLNNQLTDFSFITHVDDRPVANAAAPGKRPRSSMAPTIILKDGEPYIALGSPGGSRIIPYVAKSIVAMIDWGLDIQAAFDLPHFANRFGTFALEDNSSAVDFDPGLKALGYNTVIISLNSGLHGLVIHDDRLEGGADRRREGVVIAE